MFSFRYPCDECGRKFKHARSLREHMERQHRDEETEYMAAGFCQVNPHNISQGYIFSALSTPKKEEQKVFKTEGE